MPKLSLLLLAFALVGCSSEKKTIRGEVTEEQLGMVSTGGKEPAKEETVGTSPGMIPADCEALLNKSQAWGYIPGEKWKASSPEQMMEVSRFFGDFRLVPPAASERLRAWENGAPPPGNDLQLCDVFLAGHFLAAITEYQWGKAERLEAGKNLHRFLLNQQALSLPLAHRALSAIVYNDGVKKGLLPGSHAKAKELGQWVIKEMPGATDPLKEQALSRKIRERLGTLLPLP